MKTANKNNIPVPPKKSVWRAIELTLIQLFDYTTLHGFKLLLDLRNTKIQKFIWAVILLSNITFAIYIVIFSWFQFTENPTNTSLESQEYPLRNVPFPAIAICSVNKISKAAVTLFADELVNKTKNSYSQELILKKLKTIGAIFDISPIDQEDAIFVQEFLDKYDNNDKNSAYNMKDKLRFLAPKCEDVLIKCQWDGKDVPCLQIFELHPAADGFCCMFNYIRPKIDNWDTDDELKPNATGSSKGLQILVNASTSDYFYKTRNTNGFLVQVFNSKNFPDSTTGNFAEYLLNPQQEVNMNLIVQTLISKPAVRDYAPERRDCYFADEMNSEYGTHYSYPECLTKCKIRSISALCSCFPYFAPSDLQEKNRIYCNLVNLQCLNRYKVTWNTYRPPIEAKGFEREQEDSLSCPNCLPLCKDTQYQFETTSASLQSVGSERTNWGILKGMKDLKDISLIRIYYANPTSALYEKNVVLTWYEILASFGGILGLFLGCSIISLVEIFFFSTWRFYEILTKTKNVQKIQPQRMTVINKNRIKTNEEPNKDEPLYPMYLE